MTATVTVQGLGKRYRLGQTINRSDLLSEVITRAVSRPLRRLTGRDGGEPVEHKRDFWALRDVSLEVQESEIVGIIGRNGAGKTTLLKILSRTTAPTEGTVDIYGRVGSLLEVGTGFHPELTGRENVYLNGAILGMPRAEIARKFDEIVEFAEVGKFLDTPVKRYSSGMYVRLAFAVAAHLEPEILIVDEVLAVGDVAFQRKCLGKMDDVRRDGRTVLFVSHNMAAVSYLCTRAMLLEHGRVVDEGGTHEIIKHYLRLSDTSGNASLRDRRDRSGSGALRVEQIALRDRAGDDAQTIATGSDLVIDLDYVAASGDSLRNVGVSLAFDTLLGQRVTQLSNDVSGFPFDSIAPNGTIRCSVPSLPLNSGRYYVTLYITVGGIAADWVQKAIALDVVESDYFGTGRTLGAQDGVVVMPQAWEVEG
jgi:lipopolysaccharide transport system ATP-binding protein